MSVKINKDAIILKGALKGVKGKVVGYDNEYGLVLVRIDEYTLVEMDEENIDQSKN